MAKAPTPIYLDTFSSGLFSNRSAIVVPRDNDGVARHDALIDGSNTEISARKTLIRRPGFPDFCSSAFGSSEWPLNFWHGRLGGTLFNLVDTQTAVYKFDTSSKTSIFAKGTTAQTYFQQVGDLLYFSDGTNNKKWGGGTQGVQPPTNNGVVAPTVAPTITSLNLFDTVGATQTVHAWVPNYSYVNATATAQQFFLLAPTGEMQWVVIPKGTILTSQATAPNWQAQFGVFGGVTLDGTMTWTNCGPLGVWSAAHAFLNSTYVTVTPMSAANSAGLTLSTSGSTTINWNIPGGTPQSVGITGGNAPSGTEGATGNTNTFLAKGGITIPTNATVTGIKVTVNRASNRANAIQDVTVKLLKAGAATGNNNAKAGSWPQTMPNDNHFQPATGGIPTDYGSNTDMWGTTWSVSDVANAGFGVEFIANISSTRTTFGALTWGTGINVIITVYYAVTSGDLNSAVYQQIIVDSNGNLQGVKVSGTSAGGVPTWSTTIGGTTTDNTVTWQCLGTANKLPALFNWVYAYGFHTSSPHLSTMSPPLTVQAPIIGLNVPITGFGSDDTQVDRNDLYRSADGGPLLLYCNTAVNVASTTSWTIFDTALDVSLLTELVGPIAHVNDPPPTGMTIISYYMGRMWGVVGNLLYFSAGPDCTNGDGYQAWPPANVFTLPSTINGIAASSQGLVVLTADQFWMVLGGPQTLTFYLQPVLQEMGIMSQNCLAQDGDTLYLYTSSRQMMQLTFSGKSEIGYAVADVLNANFAPSTSAITLHRSGQDEGLFLSNGSTSVIRFSLRNGSWSPLATITGGIGMISSVETTSGTYTLLAGRAAGSLKILGRSLTTCQDGSSNYTAYATFGSLVLSPPGSEPAHIKSIILGYLGSLSDLTVGVLPNEISGSFTSIPFNVADPYQLTASTTQKMRRYDWMGVQSVLPNAIKHLQIKVSFPSANTTDEMVSLGIDTHVV